MRQAALLRRAAVLLAFIAGSTPIAPAANPAVFTLALDGPIAAAHTPYIHAIASGAFSASGLTVSLRYPEGRGAALGVLVSGGIDACIADAVSILAACAGGAKITIVASIGDLHPACLASRAESAITTPSSLVGRRVAAGPLDADRLLFPLFLTGAGLHTDDVIIVPLDTAGREAALAAGTVDAVVDRLESGRPGRAILPWAGYGFTLYGPCLAVRDETLRTRPTTVRAFLKQTLAAWETCLQEPAAAARSAAASGLVTSEAAEAWLAAVRYRFDTETYRTKGFGWIDRSRMAATLEAVRGTLGQPVTFAVADCFSTAYLPVPAVLRKIDAAAEPAAGSTPLQR